MKTLIQLTGLFSTLCMVAISTFVFINPTEARKAIFGAEAPKYPSPTLGECLDDLEMARHVWRNNFKQVLHEEDYLVISLRYVEEEQGFAIIKSYVEVWAKFNKVGWCNTAAAEAT